MLRLDHFVWLERLDMSITGSDVFYEMGDLSDVRYLLKNINCCMSEDWVFPTVCDYVTNLKMHEKNVVLTLRYILEGQVGSPELKSHFLILTITL